MFNSKEYYDYIMSKNISDCYDSENEKKKKKNEP